MNEDILILLSAAGLAAVVGWAVIAKAIPILRQTGHVDAPSRRGMRHPATPRGGGIGILAGVAATALAAGLAMPSARPPLALLAATLFVAAIGMAEDHVSDLSPLLRLTAHLIAAGFVVYCDGPLVRLPLASPLDAPLGALAAPLSLLWIVGVTNFYNFLDGIDGLAGLQGLITGLALAAAVAPHDMGLAVLSVAAAGACLAFLRFNWRPAKVFMGDVGSTALGFFFAAAPMAARGVDRSALAAADVIFLWYFVADASYTLAARAWRGERVWQPHSQHLYQRLCKTGLSPQRVTSGVGVLSLLLSALGVACMGAKNTRLAWLPWAAALALFAACRQWTVNRETGASRRAPLARKPKGQPSCASVSSPTRRTRMPSVGSVTSPKTWVTTFTSSRSAKTTSPRRASPFTRSTAATFGKSGGT